MSLLIDARPLTCSDIMQLFSEKTGDKQENKVSSPRRQHIAIKVLDPQTNNVNKINIDFESAAEFYHTQKFQKTHEERCRLASNITAASFFYKQQLPLSILKQAFQSSVQVKGTPEKMKNFLEKWGFHHRYLSDIEREGLLPLLAKIQKIDIMDQDSSGYPLNFFTKSLPLPSIGVDLSQNPSYFLQLKKAFLRRNGHVENCILHGKTSYIENKFNKVIDILEKDKSEKLAAMYQYFSRSQIEKLFLYNFFETFEKKFTKHEEEISRLIKNQVPFEEIVRILIKPDYIIEWILLCTYELKIQTSPPQEVTSPRKWMFDSFKTWLQLYTTYDAMLSEAKLDSSSEVLFVDGQYPINSIQLQSTFLEAALALQKKILRHSAVSMHLKGTETPILAFENAQGVITLCRWSGKWKSIKGESFLGAGTYGVVQKVHCLATGQIFALKTSSRKFAKNLLNEVKTLKHLNDLAKESPRKIRLNQLIACISNKKAVGMLREYREMDFLDAVERVKNYQLTFKGIYLGFLDILYTLELCAKNQIAHLDIKVDNILSDYNPVIKGFNHYLDDFGSAHTYAQIIKDKLNSNYVEETHLDSDTNLFADLYRLNKLNKVRSMIEKVEVYAFACIAFAMLTRSGFTRRLRKREYYTNLRSVHGEEIASLFCRMWKQNPKNRPGFTEIIEVFHKQVNSKIPSVIDRLNRTFDKSTQLSTF